MIGRIGRGLSKLKAGLKKTRSQIGDGVRSIVTGKNSFDEEMWEDLEELLLRSDVGASTSEEIIEELRKASGRWKKPDADQVLETLREILTRELGGDEPAELALEVESGPAVLLVVGVNGAGKTTTIAKLSSQLKAQGKSVLLVAGDTFRMAAVEQLSAWADRVGVPIVKGQEGADPGAVVFDGIESALARGADILIVDTAGRLHTKSNLMEELAKLRKILESKIPDAPHEVLLVLDATTGQNALQQARAFGDSFGVTGLVLAKLDGTAKGGVALAIRRELAIPIKLVGTGEKIDDLESFDPAAFAQALVPSPQMES